MLLGRFFVFNFFLIVLCSISATCWLLTNSEAQKYQQGDSLLVKVDRSTSSRTQLSKDYYDLPFCRPKKIEDSLSSLSDILQGHQLRSSQIEFKMLKNEECRVLCVKTLTQHETQQFMESINDDYMVNMWLDNLPVGTIEKNEQVQTNVTVNTSSNSTKEEEGDFFFVGVVIGTILDKNVENPEYVLVNHLDFVVQYSKESTTISSKFLGLFTLYEKPEYDTLKPRYVITGFKVIPRSYNFDNLRNEDILKHQESNPISKESEEFICRKLISQENESSLFILKNTSNPVVFTYSVKFELVSIPWSQRWTQYTQLGDSSHSEIHWWGLANSIVVIVFLSFLVGLVLRQTVLRDIAVYNRVEDTEKDIYTHDDVGWKLIYGDVFRRPNYGRWLAACAGTGAQLFAVFFFLLFGVCTGYISLEKRSSLLSTCLICYALFGLLGGYTAVSVAQLFEKSTPQRTLGVTYMTILLLPGVGFSIVLFINLLMHIKNYKDTLSFITIFQVFILWFFVNTPLVIVGGILAQKLNSIHLPVRTNQIPSQIPSHSWYLRPTIAPIFTGFLPFCAVVTDLFFVFTSLWYHQYYLFFGFITLTFILLMIISAEVSVAYTYLLLSVENYHWWWASFWASGFSGMYLFFYSILYYYTASGINNFFATLLYFGYSLLIAFAFTLLTGAIGFLSTFYFVRTIYSSVKIE